MMAPPSFTIPLETSLYVRSPHAAEGEPSPASLMTYLDSPCWPYSILKARAVFTTT
uniref:Alternative protein C3orf20 n=1 Tax=Homo sapiens TaxID=9606 RepID=L0R591_HUMAN|nr:alternative protein C3orf20 [Homo sapiens]